MRDVFAPELVGRDVETGSALQARLQPFKGNPFAKAGLDNAWWMPAPGSPGSRSGGSSAAAVRRLPWARISP